MKSSYSLALMAVMGTMLINTTSLRASETDNRIEASAKNSYVYRTYLANDSVKTESKDEVVTLTGTVAEESHKSLAQDTVEGLPGVKSVDNQLIVRAGDPAEHSDAWLKVKVKAALLFHRNVNGTGTDVAVVDGMVSLHGEASSLAQMELTTAYAKDVEGVKEVKNQMTISKAPAPPVETMGEKIDDASITAEVKASLNSHHSTSAIKTKVQTAAGVVTVSGVARNAAEKSLVAKLAEDTVGVTSVVNNMTVKTAVNP